MIGLRSALAVAITTFIWFATAWPNGPIAVVVAAVVCTLVASIEQPAKISAALAMTVIIATAPVFLTQFYFLPLGVDFISMSFALAPVMLACGFIMAQPKIGPLGLIAAVYFAFASNIDNVMTYDAASFLNSSLAILVGIAVAATLFAICFPETPKLAFRRFCRQLSAHLSDIAAGVQASLQTVAFDVCEQLAGTLPKVKGKPALEQSCLVAGAVAVSSSRAIVKLRAAAGANRLPHGIVAALSSLLDSVSRTYADPSQTNLVASAWEARALCRRLRMLLRAASNDVDAINDVILGCETLRSNLLRTMMLMREAGNVQ